MASANLPWVILGAVVLVALYFAASKLVMRGAAASSPPR